MICPRAQFGGLSSGWNDIDVGSEFQAGAGYNFIVLLRVKGATMGLHLDFREELYQLRRYCRSAPHPKSEF